MRWILLCTDTKYGIATSAAGRVLKQKKTKRSPGTRVSLLFITISTSVVCGARKTRLPASLSTHNQAIQRVIRGNDTLDFAAYRY